MGKSVKLILQLFAGLVYVIMGLFVGYSKYFAMPLLPIVAYSLALVFMVYGCYRIWLGISLYKSVE